MVSVYGISFDLPPTWRDTTTYVFTSKAGPILKLPIAFEPLTPADVDAWLAVTRRDISGLEGAKLGPTRRYENPELSIRGFEAAFGDGKDRMSRLVIAITFETLALLLTPKCRAGFEPFVEHLLRTFRRAPPAVAPSLEPVALGGGRLFYRLGEFSFESLQYLEPPSAYSFESADGNARLYCFRGTKPPALEPPNWSARFGLAPDAVITSELEGGDQVAGRENPPHPSPIFNARHWLAGVAHGEATRQLMYARGVTSVEAIFFELVLAREGARDESLSLWKVLLTGARRD